MIINKCSKNPVFYPSLELIKYHKVFTEYGKDSTSLSGFDKEAAINFLNQKHDFTKFDYLSLCYHLSQFSK